MIETRNTIGKKIVTDFECGWKLENNRKNECDNRKWKYRKIESDRENEHGNR